MVAIGNDDADGPTRITGKSMFGPQVLSQRHSAAAHGFGSSTRAHASKLFIGGEHAKLSSAQNSDTPGPHYATLGSVGTQAEGGKPSPPTWKLGKADRFVHDRYAARFQGASPGPGTYNHGSSVGRQPFSTNTTFPKYGFGTGGRTHTAKLFISQESPGHFGSLSSHALPSSTMRPRFHRYAPPRRAGTRGGGLWHGVARARVHQQRPLAAQRRQVSPAFRLPTCRHAVPTGCQPASPHLSGCSSAALAAAT